MHANLTLVGALCYLLGMAFAARALGSRFRLYSIATLVVLVLAGSLASLSVGQLVAHLPTPWMGAWERVDAYATMRWIAVPATSLLRAHVPPSPQTDAR
jgi:hypothetical protein